jgi:4-methylaminobutanoate oxidase (formaldehyde-forming)
MVGLDVDEDGPLDEAWLERGPWEVDVAGRRVPAVVSWRPLYDPRSERVRV